MRIGRRSALGIAVAAFLAPGLAFAIERDAKGWYMTGTGVRVKRVGPFTAKVYSISHFMRELPPTKSKAAVIAMDTDKAFSWRLLRDLEASQVQNALRDAFAMNDYRDRAKIDAFLGAFNRKLEKDANVTIAYSAANKTTTAKTDAGGSASVAGVDFMRAVWSIWFGNIDQPSLGDALISQIPASGQG
jgi:hypothetical protein